MTFVETFPFAPYLKPTLQNITALSLCSLLNEELKDLQKSKTGKGQPAQTSEQPACVCAVAGRSALSLLGSCTRQGLGTFVISFPRNRTAAWILAESLDKFYL